jgi:hypothetical protein
LLHTYPSLPPPPPASSSVLWNSPGWTVSLPLEFKDSYLTRLWDWHTANNLVLIARILQIISVPLRIIYVNLTFWNTSVRPERQSMSELYYKHARHKAYILRMLLGLSPDAPASEYHVHFCLYKLTKDS